VQWVALQGMQATIRQMRNLFRIGAVVLGVGILLVFVRFGPIWFPLFSAATQVVGSIDLYGTEGVDAHAVRANLPLKVADFAPMNTSNTHIAFEKATGHSPIEVASVCCDVQGRAMIFVGLGGRRPPNAPKPTESIRLAKSLLDVYDEFGPELLSAVKTHAPEEHSSGYALSAAPGLRAIQLRMHEAALAHTPELIKVLDRSNDDPSRRAAAHLLGYAQRSQQQVDALGKAAQDPDEGVRNNATRALGVLVKAFPETADRMNLDYFLALIHSPVWTDRNKAAMVLEAVSKRSSAAERIREGALAPLVEMARWNAPHRMTAWMILGRIGGLKEEILAEKIKKGHGEQIIAAATRP
jgi:hypothetical protein